MKECGKGERVVEEEEKEKEMEKERGREKGGETRKRWRKKRKRRRRREKGRKGGGGRKEKKGKNCQRLGKKRERIKYMNCSMQEGKESEGNGERETLHTVSN